jgi:hypothetical protein
MRDAVIGEPPRTPRADQLDDLILGHCSPTVDAPAIGRVVALDAGRRSHVRRTSRRHGRSLVGPQARLDAPDARDEQACAGASLDGRRH